MTNIEIWKDIPGYEGSYQVSNHGRVRSLERKICSCHGVCRTQPEVLMKQYLHWKGYLVIYLRRPGEKKRKFYVQRLVAVTFIPNPQNKPIVNHKDGNRALNQLFNLEWMTESENVRHGNERRAALNDEPF